MGTFAKSLVLLLAIYFIADQHKIMGSKFKFTNLVCDSVNPSWLDVHLCRLKAIRRDKTILNFNATLLQTVRKAWIHGQMFKKASGWKPWLYNISLDGCRFVRKPYVPVAALVFSMFKDNSNFNHTCPYSGSVYVMGVHIFPETIPVPLPSGDYLIFIKWYASNSRNSSTDLVISSGIYFSFEE